MVVAVFFLISPFLSHSPYGQLVFNLTGNLALSASLRNCTFARIT